MHVPTSLGHPAGQQTALGYAAIFTAGKAIARSAVVAAVAVLAGAGWASPPAVAPAATRASAIQPGPASGPLSTTPSAAPVTLVFAGDVVLDGFPGRSIARGNDPFAGVTSLLQADIRLLNLECVVATQGRASDKIFNFRAHPRTLSVLRRHVDAVALANNHSGDFGPSAFAQMLSLLDGAGIAYFGGGRNLQEAHAPLIVERQGLRVALLGYNEFMPRSFEAGPQSPGVAWSEDEQVAADIRNARAVHGAHLVIPVMHWGWENDPVATARQRQLAHLMVDAGADAVLGGHPHVTQEIEIYRNRPVIYSVGNFMMDSLDNEPQTRGWVARLDLNAAGVRGLRTDTVRLSPRGIPRPAPEEPAWCWQSGEAGISHCPPGLARKTVPALVGAKHP